MLQVERWDTDREGRVTESALRAKIEALGYHTNTYHYPPGTTFSDHTHGIDKIDAVVSGRFRISTPEDSVILGPGDLVHVPRGTVHSAEVIGEETVLSVDATRR